MYTSTLLSMYKGWQTFIAWVSVYSNHRLFITSSARTYFCTKTSNSVITTCPAMVMIKSNTSISARTVVSISTITGAIAGTTNWDIYVMFIITVPLVKPLSAMDLTWTVKMAMVEVMVARVVLPTVQMRCALIKALKAIHLTPESQLALINRLHHLRLRVSATPQALQIRTFSPFVICPVCPAHPDLLTLTIMAPVTPG